MEEIEVIICPYCGNFAPESQIEMPVDYCYHDIVELKDVTKS